MQYDISVIIPTYNAERYIVECLDSVINQSFRGTVEIILIDDCSTDQTHQIIEDYKLNHSEFPIAILYQEKNMRQGTARNRGVRESKGKYIFFLDSDDFLDLNAFEKMFTKAEEGSCDFVLCDWAYYYQEKGIVYVNNDLFLFKDYLIGEECEDLYQAVTYFSVNKLYSKEFLVNNNIKYGEGYIYEDFEFYVKVAQCAKKIGIIQNPFYRVRVNDFSTTKTESKSLIHIESYLKAVTQSISAFNPRSEQSYYHLYKHLVQKTLYYAKARAPFGHKKKTLQKVLNIVNKQNTDYFVPKNIIAFNHFLFRRKYVQNGKVNHILVVDYLQSKGKLTSLFKFAQKAKQKILKSKLVESQRRKRRAKKIDGYFKRPVDPKTVLFLGFDYRYIGNSKYFFDYLAETAQDLELYFVTKNKNVPKKYRVTPRSMKFWEVLSKAKVVFAESWIPLDFRKREETNWIQFWHGTPFKKLFFDSHERYISLYNRNHKRQKRKDISRWDYLLADSIAGQEKLASSFAYEESNILNLGYPRVQWLKDNQNNEQLKQSIRDKLGIQDGQKVILYVPTWRDYNYKQRNPKLSYLLNLNYVSENIPEDYVILNKNHSMGNFRLNHPSIITPSDDIEVQQLILISDFIISDFSSIIFDGMAINIPFYLYINDFDLYEKARGVYADMYENLKPFCIDNEDELIEGILSFEKDYPVKSYEKTKILYSNINENNSNQDLKAKVDLLLSE